jgi:hypothetical protein
MARNYGDLPCKLHSFALMMIPFQKVKDFDIWTFKADAKVHYPLTSGLQKTVVHRGCESE